MKGRGPAICPLSWAHIAGLASWQAAVIFLFFLPALSFTVLVIFAVFSLAAPFMTGVSYYLPIITRGSSGSNRVVLSFDDGPDPLTTPLLLDLLNKFKVKAVFFVTGVNATANPELIKEILKRGHEIGNHSHNHDPLLMVKGTKRLRNEIRTVQDILKEFGIRPLAFRPPVGITNPRLRRILLDEGMFCCNFSNRPCDFGNRRTRGIARRILRRLKPGDIILLHDRRPQNNNLLVWLQEIEYLISGINAAGFEMTGLAELLSVPVMEEAGASPANAVRGFYSSIEKSYDLERTKTPVYKTERALFEKNLFPLVNPNHRVCEIGAGSGIFTLILAGRAKAVTAVDISALMLKQLEIKAKERMINNIEYHAVDAEFEDIGNQYDLVCSFSCFEYFGDLEGIFSRVFASLKPGGMFYFTTAHSSPVRFFAQIGNAIRQGIWLRARRALKINAFLRRSGFEQIKIRTHHLKIPFAGGIMIEVICKKA
jgi:peptidoglycan/xylan/chitin deacetylase (PgdA/CDA1 family)/2-polyprenyl-3-methyl-5-hydroxy-6-metoxy-1,4-benzoquinol methylase